MAIPAVNASYVGNGPTANGETLADQRSGAMSRGLIAYGQFTGDGATATAVLNLVDGTITPFGVWSGPAGNQTLAAAAPKLVVGVRGVQSTDTAAASVDVQSASASTTAVTFTMSAAPGNGALITLVAHIWPY